MRYLSFIIGASLWLGSLTAKTEFAVNQAAYEAVSVSHAPDAKPKKEKVSYLKRVKAFFQALKMRLFPGQDPAYYVITILIALFIPPLAILVAGLWVKDDKWILHFLLNLLIVILAWVLFFVTCGLGAFITFFMLLGAFAHALWYIIAKGR
jgi:uncharacterized membrane protein YqaE (UPF0057 family)